MKSETESQEKKILAYMKSGRSITGLSALRKWGCFRLAARCWSLRKQGHNIVNIGESRDGKYFARYVLRKEK